jgi:hypothetical protein
MRGQPGLDWSTRPHSSSKKSAEGTNLQAALGPATGEIKPTAVLWGAVPFETVDQAASLDGRERLVK